MPPARSSRRHTARRRSRWASWSETLRAGIVLAAFGLAGIVGFGAGYLHALVDQRAYDAAPSCAPGAAQPCRWQGEGTVVELGTTSGRYSTGYWVKVSVAGKGTVMSYIDSGLWLTLNAHELVGAEIWKGKLATINDSQTKDNPDWNVENDRGLILFSAGGFILGWMLIGLWLIRRRRQGRPLIRSVST